MMLLRGFTSTREDLEDMFQEVCIKIWNGIDYFRGESSEGTWIYRITINCAINYSRKSVKRISTIPLLNYDLIESDNDSSSATMRLYDLIKKLDMADRALIMLWLENIPYDEIGLIMGISAKNVSVRLVRIKEKLKNLAKSN